MVSISESIIVGLFSIILGMVVLCFVNYINKIRTGKNNKICKSYDKTLLMATFFVTGVVLHLLCEIFNLNSWYCSKRCRPCSVPVTNTVPIDASNGFSFEATNAIDYSENDDDDDFLNSFVILNPNQIRTNKVPSQVNIGPKHTMPTREIRSLFR